MRAKLVVGIGTALSIAAGAVGCSAAGGATAPAPVTAASADPAAVLAAAAGKMGTEPVHFTVLMGSTWEGGPMKGAGVFDPATGNFEYDTDWYVMRRVGAAVYIKLTKRFIPGLSDAEIGHWIRRPMPPENELSFTLSKDFPWAPARRAANGTAITRTGAHQFHGLFPPGTWATPTVGPTEDFGETDRVTALLRGTAHPETPSTAGPTSDPANGYLVNLDAEGRFIRVRVGLGLDDPVLTYSDYGTPVKVSAPPAGDLVVDPAFDLNLIDLY